MFTNRRSFMKSSALLSCLPLASKSFFAEAQEQKLETFYSVDADNNLYLVNSAFPYEKKLLLSTGEVIGKSFVYESFCKVLNVGELTQSDNPYLIVASVADSSLVLHFLQSKIDSLENSTLHYAGKLNFETLDHKGVPVFHPYEQIACPLLPSDQEKQENPNLELFLVMFHRLERTYKIVSLEKENETLVFKSFPIQDMVLPVQASFHGLPSTLLGDSNPCFLVVDAESQQHQYLRLNKNPEDKFYTLENLLVLEDNTNLQKNWVFRFSPILDDSDKDAQGDKFHFIFKHGHEDKKSLVFLRADNKLAVLSFLNDNGTVTPQVVAVSENKYSPQDFYFHTILNHTKNQNHAIQEKEVVLCQNKKTQKCFLLSLEENALGHSSFTETEIHLETNSNSEAQKAWDGFFMDEGKEQINYYLIPVKGNKENESGVSFQILRHDRMNDDKQLVEMNFDKSETHQSFVPVTLNSEYHKDVVKKNKITLKKSYFESISDLDFNDPKVNAALAILMFLGVCAAMGIFYGLYNRFYRQVTPLTLPVDAAAVGRHSGPTSSAVFCEDIIRNGISPSPKNKMSLEEFKSNMEGIADDYLIRIPALSDISQRPPLFPGSVYQAILMKDIIRFSLRDDMPSGVNRERIVEILFDYWIGKENKDGYFYVVRDVGHLDRPIPKNPKDGRLIVSQNYLGGQNVFLGPDRFDEREHELRTFYDVSEGRDETVMTREVFILEIIRAYAANMTRFLGGRLIEECEESLKNNPDCSQPFANFMKEHVVSLPERTLCDVMAHFQYVTVENNNERLDQIKAALMDNWKKRSEV